MIDAGCAFVRPLRDTAMFALAGVGESGHSVVWPEEIDMGAARASQGGASTGLDAKSPAPLPPPLSKLTILSAFRVGRLRPASQGEFRSA